MSERTFYEDLGIAETATRDEIRKAYRKLVLKYHPDKSGDAKTTDFFVRIAEAYQVLSDVKRRADYDAGIKYRREREEYIRQQQTRPPQQPQQKPPGRDPGDLASKTTEAAVLFSQGRYDQAERVAQLVLRSDPKRAMAHAILGDIARVRQRFGEALTHYSYALQMEPANQTFARRYEEILRQSTKVSKYGEVAPQPPNTTALWVGAGISSFMLFYVAVAREAPLVERIGIIGTWTAGLLVMMFINGVIVGAALSMTQTVDKWESVARGSTGRLSPAAALGLVALVNFWASSFLYIFIGLLQNSFTYSVSRLMTVVAVLTVSYALMSSLSPTIIWHQTLLWGGNVVYMGVLAGWAVADAFR